MLAGMVLTRLLAPWVAESAFLNNAFDCGARMFFRFRSGVTGLEQELKGYNWKCRMCLKIVFWVSPQGCPEVCSASSAVWCHRPLLPIIHQLNRVDPTPQFRHRDLGKRARADNDLSRGTMAE